MFRLVTYQFSVNLGNATDSFAKGVLSCIDKGDIPLKMHSEDFGIEKVAGQVWAIR